MDSWVEAAYSTFLASIRSVGTACTLAAVGVYLHRRGFIVGDGKRTLALISQQVTIPLLFFTKIIYCNQDWSENPCPDVTQSLKDVWVLLVWPAYVVGVGLTIGHFCAKVSQTPAHQYRAVLVACGFGNSTGLPITLLTVVHANFPSSSDLGKIDPTLFLSVYLLLYPVLQWGIGGWLLSPEAPAPSMESTQSPPTTPMRTTKSYQRRHRGMDETDASMYMSVQDNLYRYQYGSGASSPNHYSTTKAATDQEDELSSIGMTLSRENSLLNAREAALAAAATAAGHPSSSSFFPPETIAPLPPLRSPSRNNNNDTTMELIREASSNSMVADVDDEEALFVPSTEASALLAGVRTTTNGGTELEHPDTTIDSEESSLSLLMDASDRFEVSKLLGDLLPTLQMILQRCLQPPVIGALLGLLVASWPTLRGILVDIVDRDSSAPLEWMFDGLYNVGQAAVPINMIILGCNLSASYYNRQNDTNDTKASGSPRKPGEEKRLFAPATMIAIVLGKMVIMPLVGFATAFLLKKWWWQYVIPPEIAGSFYLVIMIVFLTPTANNVMVMVELTGGSSNKEAIARIIAWQYAMAPILLSLTMTVAVGMADQMVSYLPN